MSRRKQVTPETQEALETPEESEEPEETPEESEEPEETPEESEEPEETPEESEEPEETPEESEEPEETQGIPEGYVEESKYRELLIRFSQVPEEIVAILPKALGDLEEYLESDVYKALKAKLEPKPGAPVRTPKAKPRSYEPPKEDSLTSIGRLFAP